MNTRRTLVLVAVAGSILAASAAGSARDPGLDSRGHAVARSLDRAAVVADPVVAAAPALDASLAVVIHPFGADLQSMRLATGPIHLSGVQVAPGVTLALDLEPATVFAPDAKVVAMESDGQGGWRENAVAIPAMSLLRGRVTGDDSSRAFIGITAAGVNGFVASGGKTYWISSGPAGANLPDVSFDPADLPEGAINILPWTCAADELEGYPQAGTVTGGGGVAGAAPCRVAQVAVETDHEYLANLFGGNQEAATGYAATIFGAMSEIYRAQLNTRFEIVFFRLWPVGNDPWTADSTSSQLSQYQSLWSGLLGQVDRTIGHFLSGRPLGGGIAWLSALCSFQNGYAVSANLGGFFPYPLVDHSGQNWDIMVTSHEMGHNFGSPHTHDYGPPLDGCGLGDCSQAFGGTIMSYCHLCPGGISNMVMEFHPANVDTMIGFLDSDASCVVEGAPASAGDDVVLTLVGAPIDVDVLSNDFDDDCDVPQITSFSGSSAAGGSVALGSPLASGGYQTLTYAPPAGYSGGDSFSYSISSSSSVDSATVNVSVVTPLPAVDPGTVSPKLRASYYALSNPAVLPDFTALIPIAGELAANIAYPSTGGVFAGSGLSNNVGAVFEGYIYASIDDIYTFYLESDDGSRLRIDGQVIVDNDGLHGMLEQSGVVGLKQGYHAFRVEFFEAGGGAGVIARFSSGSVAKKIIGPENLSHGVSADLNGDGAVDGADLGILLGAWGSASIGADVNEDGVVDGADMGLLLGAWG